MDEFIVKRIVSRFPSFEENCGFVILNSYGPRNKGVRKAGVEHLEIIADHSRAVYRVVQRTQFIFFVREMPKSFEETRSVGKDKVHREMDLFRDAQEKAAMDNLQ